MRYPTRDHSGRQYAASRPFSDAGLMYKLSRELVLEIVDYQAVAHKEHLLHRELQTAIQERLAGTVERLLRAHGPISVRLQDQLLGESRCALGSGTNGR